MGIAIGFGAQTLVKDFTTGFTIILLELLQIDDVVTIAGRTGMVSHVAMRKIELRSLEGTVHRVPFGVIDIVDNLTRDFSDFSVDRRAGPAVTSWAKPARAGHSARAMG